MKPGFSPLQVSISVWKWLFIAVISKFTSPNHLWFSWIVSRTLASTGQSPRELVPLSTPGIQSHFPWGYPSSKSTGTRDVAGLSLANDPLHVFPPRTCSALETYPGGENSHWQSIPLDKSPLLPPDVQVLKRGINISHRLYMMLHPLWIIPIPHSGSEGSGHIPWALSTLSCQVLCHGYERQPLVTLKLDNLPPLHSPAPLEWRDQSVNSFPGGTTDLAEVITLFSATDVYPVGFRGSTSVFKQWNRRGSSLTRDGFEIWLHQ